MRTKIISYLFMCAVTALLSGCALFTSATVYSSPLRFSIRGEEFWVTLPPDIVPRHEWLFRNGVYNSGDDEFVVFVGRPWSPDFLSESVYGVRIMATWLSAERYKNVVSGKEFIWLRGYYGDTISKFHDQVTVVEETEFQKLRYDIRTQGGVLCIIAIVSKEHALPTDVERLKESLLSIRKSK